MSTISNLDEIEAAAVDGLCHAADAVIAAGVQYARVDDPHRVASLPREFDNGMARRRLVLDYLPAGQVRISLQFSGTLAGEDRLAELFAFTVQGPITGDLQ